MDCGIHAREWIAPAFCQYFVRQVKQLVQLEKINKENKNSNASHPSECFTRFGPRQILNAYKTEPKMQEMMTNVDFFVTPVLNVDGYMYTWVNSTDSKVRTGN